MLIFSAYLSYRASEFKMDAKGNIFLVCYIGHYCRTFILRIVINLPCRLLNVVFTCLFVNCMTGL